MIHTSGVNTLLWPHCSRLEIDLTILHGDLETIVGNLGPIWNLGAIGDLGDDKGLEGFCIGGHIGNGELLPVGTFPDCKVPVPPCLRTTSALLYKIS